MRRENLPAEGDDKVIWKRSGDRSRDKASRQRNSETWWRCTAATLLGVSFGSYRRRRRDILMEMSWIHTTETSWWGTTETSLGVSFETYLRRRGDVLMGRRHYVPMRRHHDIPIRRREDVPLRRLGDVPLRGRGMFHLRRTCDVAGTHLERSLRRRRDVLLPGGNLTRILMTMFHWAVSNFPKLIKNGSGESNLKDRMLKNVSLQKTV